MCKNISIICVSNYMIIMSCNFKTFGAFPNLHTVPIIKYRFHVVIKKHHLLCMLQIRNEMTQIEMSLI